MPGCASPLSNPDFGKLYLQSSESADARAEMHRAAGETLHFEASEHFAYKT